ncbi:MAG: tetratricopeptide repeat protein [Treponema sp.]|nr:tetratricopeptide repeat protein [Treponema sp.]
MAGFLIRKYSELGFLMLKGKRIFTLFLILFVSLSTVFASESAMAAYLEGCKAFSRGEWSSAVFLLKKAASYPENNNADTYYMLIAAEISAEENKTALGECDFFLKNFSSSIYVPRIKYMKGKLLYSLGEYEKSIVVLSDFCHQYQVNNEADEDGLYSSALFYIAECLFNDYKYEEAEAIYKRIVTQYPESEKIAASQFRIESIAQHSREEKLLYLLKQTGEEYLSAKEDYEKQLRLYNSEAINTTRQRLVDAQQRNKDLEEQIKLLQQQITELKQEQLLMAENVAVVLDSQDIKPVTPGSTEVLVDSSIKIAEDKDSVVKMDSKDLLGLDNDSGAYKNQKDTSVLAEDDKNAKKGLKSDVDTNIIENIPESYGTDFASSMDLEDTYDSIRLLKAKAFLLQQLLDEKQKN